MNTTTKPGKRSTSPSAFRKYCDLCHKTCDVLVRCQIDDTAKWHLICPKSCWKGVSGGIPDGTSDHPYYKYGGMWKNKHALVSAKKPKHRNQDVFKDWRPERMSYVIHDKVQYEGKTWICRRSHESDEKNAPSQSYRFWKEAG